MSNEDVKKKIKELRKVPIYFQTDKVLEQLFNDEDSSQGSSQELQQLKDSLKPVAFSGSYNDLTDVPTNVDGSYNDEPIKAQLQQLTEKVDAIDLTKYLAKEEIEIATSDELLTMYNGQ